MNKNQKNLTKQFIEKHRRVYKNKFNYSKVEYVNNKTAVCLINNETNEEIWVIPEQNKDHRLI